MAGVPHLLVLLPLEGVMLGLIFSHNRADHVALQGVGGFAELIRRHVSETLSSA
jgi:hypothetical protein